MTASFDSKLWQQAKVLITLDRSCFADLFALLLLLSSQRTIMKESSALTPESHHLLKWSKLVLKSLPKGFRGGCMPQGDFIFEKSTSSKSACRDSFIISWEVEGEQTLCTKLFGCKFIEIIIICSFQKLMLLFHYQKLL